MRRIIVLRTPGAPNLTQALSLMPEITEDALFVPVEINPAPATPPEVDNRHERRKRAAKGRRWSR